jgi:tRNA U34 2-thiouridine synthase MnmA/TrmU
MMIRKWSSSVARHPRIAVAMSGGVDSSVVAYLLRQEYPETELLGVHMSNWDYHTEDHTSNLKCWEQDWKDAKAVAQHVGLPIVHTSFEADYWNSVFEPYVDQISKHKTPNPDVDCNRYIKFGVLKEFLWSKYQLDTLATGHYARLWDPSRSRPDCLQEVLSQDPSIDALLSKTTPTLLAAKDLSKDQSYFLSGVSGEALRNVLFPLGDYLKQPPTTNKAAEGSSSSTTTVRQLALQAQLPNARKRDSMGICFVGKRKHGEFVQDFLDPPKEGVVGQILNVEDGSVVSTFDPHNQPSLLYATIGQGAKIGGASQKWFVVEKSDATTLMVCPGTHHPALYADSFVVDRIHWMAGEEPPLPLMAQCRIRHLQPLVDCEIRRRQDAPGYEIVTSRPFRGIAPGQVCGIYLRDLICLGGGTITQRGPTYMDLQKLLPDELHPAGQNDLSTTIKSFS